MTTGPTLVERLRMWAEVSHAPEASTHWDAADALEAKDAKIARAEARSLAANIRADNTERDRKLARAERDIARVRAEAAERDLAVFRAALEPFADKARLYFADDPDDLKVKTWHLGPRQWAHIRLGDLRRAALATTGQETPPRPVSATPDEESA